MAVLLPVLLLAGLAKKLFAPLALTVAVAMIASYFVSMCVTPVACRYFLGHAEHGRLGKRVEAFIDRHRRRATPRRLRRVLPFRAHDRRPRRSSWWSASGWAADAPAEHVLPRDRRVDGAHLRAPRARHLARRSRRELINAMGEDAAAQELPQGAVELVLTNVGSPNNARSAMTSPNRGPHMGFIRLALVDPEERKLAPAARSPTGCARSSMRDYPGRRALAVARRPGGQRVRQRLHRAAGRRGARRQPRGARRAGQGGGRGRAHRPRRARHRLVAARWTTPRFASTPTARRRAWSA